MIEVVLTVLGVAVPSLLITLAVRHWLEPLGWRIPLLLLALVFVFTARGVFTPDMPVPLDEVARGYPYRGIFGEVTAKNPMANDTTKQILPWMRVVREQMAQGRAPLWNPYLFSGYPLLGNGQSAPFSPFFLLTLFVPLPKQLVAMAGLKLFTALLFGFLLLRRERVSDRAALFGSVVFAFAIFNNVFLYYPMTAVTLLLPAAAYGVLLALHRRSGASFVFLALVVAALLAGGHPESVVHVAAAVAVLAMVEWLAPQWSEQRFGWRDLGRVTLASVLGLVFSAPAWVPVLEQAMSSLRVMQIGDSVASAPYPRNTLWAMVNPDGYGNPARGTYGWIMSYTHVATVYLGLIPTVLFAASVVSPYARKRDRLLVLVALLVFLVSMHWTVLSQLAYAAPPLSWVAHDRLRFVVCFLVGIVAARAVTRSRGADAAFGLVASVVILALAAHVFDRMWGRTLGWWSLAGLGCLGLYWIGSLRWPRLAPALAFGLTTIELFVFTFDYNAISDRRYYAPKLPILEALRSSAAAAPPEPFRILGLDWMLLPNAAAQYGLEDIRGSDPMEWGDYARFFRTAEVDDRAVDVKRINDPEKPAVDFLNVRYLLTEPGARLSERWMRVYGGADGELYLNTRFMARFFVPRLARRVEAAQWEEELMRSPDSHETPLVFGPGVPPVVVNPGDAIVTCRAHGPTEFRLRVATTGRTLVASSQPAMKGWEVRVNRKRVPVLRVNGAFMGFWVPAGTSDVRVIYRSMTYRAAVAAALLGLLGTILAGRFFRDVAQTAE